MRACAAPDDPTRIPSPRNTSPTRAGIAQGSPDRSLQSTVCRTLACASGLYSNSDRADGGLYIGSSGADLGGRTRTDSINKGRTHVANASIPRLPVDSRRKLASRHARRPRQEPAAPALTTGDRVIIREAATLQVDDEKPGRDKEADARRVYRIDRVDGPRLHLAADGVGLKGWIKAQDAIPPKEAFEYVTDLIYDRPDESALRLWRGRVRQALVDDDGPFAEDEALDDFSKAIRLDPKNALAYLERGALRRDSPTSSRRSSG